MARLLMITCGCVAGFHLLMLPISDGSASAREKTERSQPPFSTAFEPPAKPATWTGLVAREDSGQQAGKQQKRTDAKDSTPQYKPPTMDRPWRTVGGATRGPDGALPEIAVLAPRDHAGHTLAEQPSLYWYISGETTAPVVFTLIDEQGIAPLLEVQLPAPSRPGIQTLSLADFDVKLSAGQTYQWSVALVPDPQSRSRDIVAEGGVVRIEPDGDLAVRLHEAGNMNTPFVYAEAGLWYDALASVSRLIALNPDDEALRSQRAALLEQVGLEWAAREGGNRPRSSAG